MRFCRIGKIAVTLAAVLVVAGGCAKKDATGIAVNVTGTWGGTGTQGGLSISFMMTVTEDGTGSITGNGTVTTFGLRRVGVQLHRPRGRATART